MAEKQQISVPDRLNHITCILPCSNPACVYFVYRSRLGCALSCRVFRHHTPATFTTTVMFQSSSTFQSSTAGASNQEQRSPFQHSHSHPVQYNGSPFTVAGMSSMSNLNQSASTPNVRGGSMGLGMGSSLGAGSPLGESLSQSRSHYQPGYLMVSSCAQYLPEPCLMSRQVGKPKQRESPWRLNALLLECLMKP